MAKITRNKFNISITQGKIFKANLYNSHKTFQAKVIFSSKQNVIFKT